MTSSHANPYLLLEERIAVLRQLTSAVEDAQQSVMRSDVDGLDRNTAEQKRLCRRLQQLLAENCGACYSRENVTEAMKPLERELLDQEAEARRELRRASLVHAALLRRMQTWVRIMTNLVEVAAPGYQPTGAATGVVEVG